MHPVYMKTHSGSMNDKFIKLINLIGSWITSSYFNLSTKFHNICLSIYFSLALNGVQNNI